MMRTNRKYAYAWIYRIVLALLVVPSVLFGSEDRLGEYMRQKSLCNYTRAIEILEEWCENISDPCLIETNVFRIYELLKYPDLYEKGLDALKGIRENRIVKESPFLKARVESMVNLFSLKKGRIDEAVKIRDSLGFIRRYRIVGPFSNGGEYEFSVSQPPESGYDRDALYIGKVYYTGWFDADVDLAGTVNIVELYPEIKDTLFYLQSNINIAEERNYVFCLGKTGFTDVWLDGEKIFSVSTRHGYFLDQYFLKVRMSAGIHRLLIKTGDTAGDELMVSVRVTDEQGNPVNVNSDREYTGDASSELIEAGYFKTLSRAIGGSGQNNGNNFLAGYLIYISGLNSPENREASEYLNRVRDKGVMSWAASYYLGLLQKEDEKRDFYLYESLAGNGKNIEALKEIAEIKIKNNFSYEASPIIESIRKIKPLSDEYLILKTDLMLSMGWYDEAVKTARLLQSSQYPAEGHRLEARVHRLNKRYSEAAEGYIHAYISDRYSLSKADRLIECYEFQGRSRDIEKILYSAAVMFPNSMWVRLKLAEVKLNYYNAGAALPYLSAAMRLSPYNRQVFFDTGMAYHKLGKEELAVYYLRRALNYDPNNFELKRYLRIIAGEKNEIDEYLIKRDPLDIAIEARGYSSEPAVILLNETAFRVLPEGSYEKRVHRIVQINEESAVREFSSPYVVIDPDTDRVEDFRCAVYNNGERLESSEVSRRSLSDPESRLYYDVEAYIITLPSVREGSIVEMQYTVKSRGGAEYKNYFGEKIIPGDQYRTIISNNLISFPENKRIYYFLKDISDENFSSISSGGRKIYRVYKEDIPPYKQETAMPHHSEVLPCAYFTTFRDWGELCGWYSSLVKDKIKISEEMKGDLKKIINEDDTSLEKVRKIYDHVNSIIRYVGFEFGIGGIQPRSSEITYHTRMGDCKDMSLVLTALLREAGLDAGLALLRVRDSGAANLKVPFLGEFNHAICYVNLNGGFFIDGTAKMGGFRELPDQDSGVTALVLKSGGYSFINTNSKIYLENMESADTVVDFQKDGSAFLSRTITRQGSSAAAARSISMNRERWSQRIREYWNKRFPGSSISNLKIINMEKDRPVSYNYNVAVPSFLNTGKDEIVFDSFMASSNYYKYYAMFKKREFPIALSRRWTEVVKIRYSIPEGFSVFRIPGDESYKHDKFSAAFTFIHNKKKGYIEVESRVRFMDYRIDVGEYGKFRSFARFIDRKENEKIILVRKGEKISRRSSE